MSKTGTDIIAHFDTLTDNLSELSTNEKLELANRKYRKLKREREWEDLRTSTEIAISSNAIVLPDDFRVFAPNEYGQDAPYKYVFYIDDTPYPIVRMAERKKFRDYSYFNPALGNTGHIVTPDSVTGTAELDYYAVGDDMTLTTSPVFPGDFHDIIGYMMAVEHYAIDQTEEGRKKVDEYLVEQASILADMEYHDNQLKDSWIDHA